MRTIVYNYALWSINKKNKNTGTNVLPAARPKATNNKCEDSPTVLTAHPNPVQDKVYFNDGRIWIMFPEEVSSMFLALLKYA